MAAVAAIVVAFFGIAALLAQSVVNHVTATSITVSAVASVPVALLHIALRVAHPIAIPTNWTPHFLAGITVSAIQVATFRQTLHVTFPIIDHADITLPVTIIRLLTVEAVISTGLHLACCLACPVVDHAHLAASTAFLLRVLTVESIKVTALHIALRVTNSVTNEDFQTFLRTSGLEDTVVAVPVASCRVALCIASAVIHHAGRTPLGTDSFIAVVSIVVTPSVVTKLFTLAIVDISVMTVRGTAQIIAVLPIPITS